MAYSLPAGIPPEPPKVRQYGIPPIAPEPPKFRGAAQSPPNAAGSRLVLPSASGPPTAAGVDRSSVKPPKANRRMRTF